ncbi:hypothetical protein [Tardiphaga sp.]|uniref:hypothetical protein n=1 Tax=Tardiphaga sp. TaxID=1926292 RepID=UPI002634FEF1|nr:hypothetical protein [Tardiphaga sp.]MDB5619433.1 hypothetical protein [Tardiphaga sp.]
MDKAEKDNKERDITIAGNESARQTGGDIRVSTWTIAFTVLVALAVFGWILTR